MKKTVLFTITALIINLLCFSITFAAEKSTSVFNLHTDGAYVLDLNYRPMDLQITNKNVVNAEAVTDILGTESQLVIRTFDEGISYITYKSNNIVYTIKVLVDNKEPVDDSLLEIDKVKEP